MLPKFAKDGKPIQPFTHEHPSARQGRSTTIRDIADAAKVAPSTVSRALSQPGRINPDTARRIQDIANALGYQTTRIRSTSTETGFNGMLAITLADISNPVFADYTRSVQARCFSNNLGLMVIDTKENAALEGKAINLASRHVDGIILSSSRLPNSDIRKLAQSKPIVALNRPIRGIQSVIGDPEKGLEQAVNHLHALGHRSITYLSGPEFSWQNGMRWEELSRICKSQNITKRRVASDSPTFSGGYRCLEAFRARPTSAVIAYNDILAIGFIKALRSVGIDVPGDVSVVGIDDVQFSSLVTPALSTVHLPRKELGTQAVDEMIRLLQHNNHTERVQPIVLDSTFIARASTGPAQ